MNTEQTSKNIFMYINHLYLKNVTLQQVFFKHFASKSQLPGFYTSRTLVKNGLRTTWINVAKNTTNTC